MKLWSYKYGSGEYCSNWNDEIILGYFYSDMELHFCPKKEVLVYDGDLSNLILVAKFNNYDLATGPKEG